MAVDLSSLGYFLPILSYLIVFLVVYAASKKAGMFSGEFTHLFVSFVVATIFVTASGPRAYVESIVPWFAILVVSFFMILAFIKFSGAENIDKKVAMGFAIALIGLFVISGVIVFSSYFSPYLPWNSPAGGDPNILRVTDWIFSPRVFGAILLLGITALISWAVVKNQ